jgi:methylphosphotriester-DNA--protein-cysteine methyltransferase
MTLPFHLSSKRPTLKAYVPPAVLYAGDYARHYRNVCDAKTVDSLNSGPAIYHCHGIASRFLERVGTAPAEWVVTSRVRPAQQFLETTRLSVEEVVAHSEFRSASVMREHFAGILGIGSLAYRRSFVPAKKI